LIYLRWDEALRVERATESLRDRLIVRLPLYVGMRAHEVADARIKHVDPLTGWIYIPHGHTSGPRYASIDDETLRLLAVYAGSRKKGPLLTREDGKPLTRWIVYYATRKAGEKSGVVKPKPIGPLMLKHTFATTWLRGKPDTKMLKCPFCSNKILVQVHSPGNIRLLQKQLGHKHLKSTAYYLDWILDDVKHEHERLFDMEAEASTVEGALRTVVTC